ncbi:hypothetical protein K24_02710 [Klebsiella pneumoniae]|nr:hypothetical protein K24_02710 [Klebsiella pneumoniae]
MKGSIAEHSPQRTGGNTRHFMRHNCIFFTVVQSDKRNQPFRASAARVLFNRQQRDHNPAVQLADNIAGYIKQ